MKKSIYTYDKEKNCALCRHNNAANGTVQCALGKGDTPCTQFAYDVFKRTPKKRPQMPQYQASDFEL